MSGSAGAAAAATPSRVTTSYGVSIPVGAVSKVVSTTPSYTSIVAPKGVSVYVPGSPLPVKQTSALDRFLGTMQQVSGIVGTVSKAVGQVTQARTQAAVANYNAAVLKQQAYLIREQGKLDRRVLERRNRAFSSRQVALFAKAGIGLTGSALDVMSDDASELELDLLINDFNAENRARAAEQGAYFQELTADEIRNEGFASAGATLLTQLPDFIKGTFGSKKT